MPKLCCICKYYTQNPANVSTKRTFPYVSSPAKGNFVLEFPSIKSTPQIYI